MESLQAIIVANANLDNIVFAISRHYIDAGSFAIVGISFEEK